MANRRMWTGSSARAEQRPGAEAMVRRSLQLALRGVFGTRLDEMNVIWITASNA
jgi:hypothetical protein